MIEPHEKGKVTQRRKELYATVKRAVEIELSIWPPEQDGSKRPYGKHWKERQITRATIDELRTLYKDKSITGVGLILGAASKNLEFLDFDERTIFDAFRQRAIDTGLGIILDRIEAGYKENTPNGVHLPYYCDEIGGNTKLATRPKRPEEMKDANDKTKTLIETRGQGGYIIIAPTYGSVNPDGNYDLISGSIEKIETITPEERRDLFNLARTFHIEPKDNLEKQKERIQRESKDGGRPGDDFDERATWNEILEPHGWQFVFSHAGMEHWRRPGKTAGVSATIGHNGTDLFHCFTSSSQFDPNRSYRKFTAFAVLNHAGDFQAAARELASKGFGIDTIKNKNNSLYREDVPVLSRLFENDTRDNDLLDLANHLETSRYPKDKAFQVIEKMALSCIPPFDPKEIYAKIENAFKCVARRQVNVAELVERYVAGTFGDFSGTDVYTAVQSETGGTNRDTVRKSLIRLCDKGAIQRSSKKDGVYRRVVNECADIDFLNAPSTVFDIHYPFRIENYVTTHPGNIIIVAGAPNSGKTAFLLNVVEKNMFQHDNHYFSSEIGPAEFRDRLSKFERPLDSWHFFPKERASNFADVIQPDAINIIDFLEIHEDFWKVGLFIKEIYDKLNKGIAIIALQKNPGVSYGLGGARSLEKARLYLSMDNNKIKIEKGKNWTNPNINPNGLEAEYKLVKGCEFITTKPWGKS